LKQSRCLIVGVFREICWQFVAQSTVFYADANPCKATVDLTDENQNIKLPVDPVPQGQPVYYPNNAFCQWRLTVPFDHVRIITLPRRWQLPWRGY